MRYVLIGPPGNLQRVFPPRPGMAVQAARASSKQTPIHGLPRVTRSPKAARTWSWEQTRLTDDEVAVLQGLEQEVYGPGPYLLYDPVVAKSNMLTPELAALGYRGVVPPSVEGGLVPAGPALLEDGTRLGYSAVGRPFTLPAVPVVAGRAYTFVAHVSGGDSAEATLNLFWTLTDGTTTLGAHETTPTPAGNSLRRVEVRGVAPAGAASVTVTGGSDLDAPVWAGLLLVEGVDGPVRWRPGEGMPWVVIEGGLSQTYQHVGPDGSRRDVSFTLTEVQA